MFKLRLKCSSRSPTHVLRHKVLHDYHDHADAEATLLQGIVAGDKRKGPRGGVTVPFPARLHSMISKVEEDGLSHIVSW